MYIFNFEKKFWLYIIKYVILSPSLPSQFAHLLGFCCYCSCIFTMLSFFFLCVLQCGQFPLLQVQVHFTLPRCLLC
jgi:hypothetical protein